MPLGLPPPLLGSRRSTGPTVTFPNPCGGFIFPEKTTSKICLYERSAVGSLSLPKRMNS